MWKNNRPLLLTLVCLVLAVLVYIDNRGDGDDAPPVRTQAPASAPADDDAPMEQSNATTAPKAGKLELSNPLASLDKAMLKDWVERPLFAPSRKHPPAVSAAERPLPRRVTPTLAPPSYDLLGILRDGDRAIALLRKRGEGTSFRVEVGDMIGGWRVARMEPASVVLEREDGISQTVPLSQE